MRVGGCRKIPPTVRRTEWGEGGELGTASPEFRPPESPEFVSPEFRLAISEISELSSYLGSALS